MPCSLSFVGEKKKKKKNKTEKMLIIKHLLHQPMEFYPQAPKEI